MRVALVTILARNMRLKIFLKSTVLWSCECRLVTILAGEMRLKVFSTKSRANNVTSRARKISFLLIKFVEKMSFFNRIYRANIVTSGPRSTSKASFVEKLSIAFLAQTYELRHSHHTVSEACMFPSHIPHQYRDVLARNRM